MAKSLTIEEESGVVARTQHQHQHHGYYAGDFTNVPFQELRLSTFPRHTTRMGEVRRSSLGTVTR